MTNTAFKTIAALFVAGNAMVWLSSCLHPRDVERDLPKYIRNLTNDSLQIQSQWPDSFHRVDKWELGGGQTLKPPYNFGLANLVSPPDLRVTLRFYGNPNHCYIYSGPTTSESPDLDIRWHHPPSYREISEDSAVFFITQAIRDSAKPCE